MNNVFVIYSEDLKGFLSEDGETLTKDISNAMKYDKAGDAIRASVETGFRLSSEFRFFQLWYFTLTGTVMRKEQYFIVRMFKAKWEWAFNVWK